MKITTDRVKELREQCGAGVMECRNVLIETEGDMEKALQLLRERNLFKAEKRKERTVSQGLVVAYVHAGGRIGAMVEVNCETDFVARTSEFKELAHNLAMQIAAMEPKCITKEEVPQGSEMEIQTICLLAQPYIKDTTITVQDVINEAIAKVGENIKVTRFARFEVGA